MGLTVKELDVLMQKIRGTSVLSLEEFLPNERGYEIPLLDTLRDDGNEVSSAVEAREIKAALVRAGAVGENKGSTRTVPVKHCAGPFAEGRVPLRLSSMVLGFSKCRLGLGDAEALADVQARRGRQLHGEIG